MATTTIRVDTDTHARLQAMSKESGRSLIDTIRDATEALGRQRFAHQVAAELTVLRTDEDSWKAYLAEAESTSVADGINR
jgi:predicted transcriptional regulator